MVANKLQKKFDPDDLSKNMFMAAFNDAMKACGGRISELSRRLGLHARCGYWRDHQPPYPKMQEYYPKLLEIAQEQPKEKQS